MGCRYREHLGRKTSYTSGLRASEPPVIASIPRAFLPRSNLRKRQTCLRINLFSEFYPSFPHQGLKQSMDQAFFYFGRHCFPQMLPLIVGFCSPVHDTTSFQRCRHFLNSQDRFQDFVVEEIIPRGKFIHTPFALGSKKEPRHRYASRFISNDR